MTTWMEVAVCPLCYREGVDCLKGPAAAVELRWEPGCLGPCSLTLTHTASAPGAPTPSSPPLSQAAVLLVGFLLLFGFALIFLTEK